MDVLISRESMRIYYMNKQQEVLTLCPKAISSREERASFPQNLGLAEGLAEMVTALTWFICKKLFWNRDFTNLPLFLSSISLNIILRFFQIFPNTCSLWLCLSANTISLLSGMWMGSTAVYDAVKFGHLLYGKQVWEIVCGPWDPAMLWRMRIRVNAKTGGQLLALNDLKNVLSCLSHAGQPVAFRGSILSSFQHDEKERYVEWL